MAKSILTTDMVSIGLLLAKGELTISMKELSEKVNQWQTENNRIFGITPNDYTNALILLVMDELNPKDWLTDFQSLTFHELIPKILKYNEVYFNDEGEHWMETVQYEEWQLNQFFGVDQNEYESKLRLKEAMTLFFNSRPTDGNRVKNFMVEQKIGNNILTSCSFQLK